MKILFQIPILFLLIFMYSIKMTATGAPVFSNDDVEVWVHNSCIQGTPSGKIDLRIMSDHGPFQVIYYDEDQNELKNVHVITGNGGEEDLDNISSGNYRVEVISYNCGLVNIEVLVGSISNIEIRADLSPICQFGGGTIIPEITGGEEPFTYNWSNGVTSSVISGLDAGTYTLTLTDNRSCQNQIEFTLQNSTSPFWFAEDLEVILPTTCSSQDGYIHAWRQGFVSGGVAPLNYLWSSGETTNSIGPVASGTYTVTITGSDGCQGIKEQELHSLNHMIILYENEIPTCPGVNDGSLEVIANHEALYICEQLNYSSQEGLYMENLPPGTYCISILSLMDEVCKIDKCYTVIEKIRDGDLLHNAVVKNSCPGEDNGSIKLNVSGGFSNYGKTIVWENYPSFWNYGGNLPPDEYIISVEDACGETITQSYTIEEFDVEPLNLTWNYEESDNTLNITVTGGTGDYTYSWYWKPFENSNWTKTNLSTKKIVRHPNWFYKVVVTDANTGCIIEKVIKCLEFEAIITPTCVGWEEGQIILRPILPTGSVTYSWSNNSNHNDVINSKLAEGDYYVTVTRYGCRVIDGPLIVLDNKPVEWNPFFEAPDLQNINCGYSEKCNGGQPKIVEYDKNKHKSRISDMTKDEITEIPDECFKTEIYCPATGTSKTITRAHIEDPDWENCERDLFCPNTLIQFTSIPGEIIEKFELIDNSCKITQECFISGHIDRFKDGVRTEYEYDELNNRCCPKENSLKATNVKMPNSFTNVSLNYNEQNSWSIIIIISKNDKEKRRFNYSLTGGSFKLNVGGLEEGVYTISINMPGFCPDLITTFRIEWDIPTNSCPDLISLDRNPYLSSVDVSLITSSPVGNSVKVKVYDSNNEYLKEFDFYIEPGNNKTKKLTLASNIGAPGVYFLRIQILGCTQYELRIIIIPGSGLDDDDDDVLRCKSTIIDVSFDSLQNHFTYFDGQFETDSIFGNSLYNDTLQGYHNEFTRHEIEWEWVKHVRYDSTKTVFYFGTDSIIRSFITAIDSNGQSYTEWFHDIIFVSCSPLNKKGFWTLIGYSVSEQKYYMYVYDKVNLTALPLDIPNENRGQTYTTVWNFGPDEFATKIISAQFEIVKFFTLAYPPFEVSISRPLKIKTVTKWNSNQWLITGDLKGIIIIGEDTIVSEEWTKTVLIWYDWQGTVIKYKVIESEEDRIITHLATDGHKFIFFTGIKIDTIFHENPDSIVVDTCTFGDTLTIDGIPESYRSQDTWESIAIYTPQSEDPNYIRFYPNPFNQGINVRVDSPHQDDVYLKVIGVMGNTVLEKKWKVSAGLNEIYLREFEPLPGGLYTVWVRNSKGENAYRLVKIE